MHYPCGVRASFFGLAASFSRHLSACGASHKKNGGQAVSCGHRLPSVLLVRYQRWRRVRKATRIFHLGPGAATVKSFRAWSAQHGPDVHIAARHLSLAHHFEAVALIERYIHLFLGFEVAGCTLGVGACQDRLHQLAADATALAWRINTQNP